MIKVWDIVIELDNLLIFLIIGINLVHSLIGRKSILIYSLIVYVGLDVERLL